MLVHFLSDLGGVKRQMYNTILLWYQFLLLFVASGLLNIYYDTGILKKNKHQWNHCFQASLLRRALLFCLVFRLFVDFHARLGNAKPRTDITPQFFLASTAMRHHSKKSSLLRRAFLAVSFIPSCGHWTSSLKNHLISSSIILNIL